VIDYGIATLRYAHKPPSQSSGGTPALVGAVSYMAPEQAHGARPDARADQFALAAVAFEMLAGKGPFGYGSPVAILARVIHADPPPMIGVSREIEKVVLRGLAKKPEDRWASVEAFSDALLTAAGRRASARGASGATPTIGPNRRFPAEPWMVSTKLSAKKYPDSDDDFDPPRRRNLLPFVIAGSAVVVALVVGLIVGVRLTPSPPAPAPAAPVAPKPPAPAEPDPSQIELTIEVDPPYARVRIGDRQVSPPTVRLPRGADPVQIVVDAPEHLPSSREIVPDSDQHLVVRLTSTAAPTLHPRPASPAPPPASAPRKPGRPIGSGVGTDLRDPFE
jgi:serine/threonine protein kinase